MDIAHVQTSIKVTGKDELKNKKSDGEIYIDNKIQQTYTRNRALHFFNLISVIGAGPSFSLWQTKL